MLRTILMLLAIVSIPAHAFFAPDPDARKRQDGYQLIRWQAGWQESNPGFLRRDGGIVSLQVNAVSMQAASGNLIVLPHGFRPAANVFHVPAIVHTHRGAGIASVHVHTNGTVVVDTVVGSGATFMTQGADYVSLTLTFPAP